MVKQTPPDANRRSDDLSRVAQELANAQAELQHFHQRLTALHRLTDALACSPDEEGIIKALTKGLPTLVDTVMVGIARSNRNRIWIRSDPWNRERGGACAPVSAPQTRPIPLSPYGVVLSSTGGPFTTSLSRPTCGIATVYARTGFHLWT